MTRCANTHINNIKVKLHQWISHLFKLFTNLLVGWKRWRRLLDTECFLPGAGALHCSVWGEEQESQVMTQKLAFLPKSLLVKALSRFI